MAQKIELLATTGDLLCMFKDTKKHSSYSAPFVGQKVSSGRHCLSQGDINQCKAFHILSPVHRAFNLPSSFPPDSNRGTKPGQLYRRVQEVMLDQSWYLFDDKLSKEDSYNQRIDNR
jgi:hypothetical protein